MRLVIISDIHGNYDALSALPETHDELWVLGDLVNYGPQPREVVNFVREHATVVVRGNHDQAVGYDEDPRCTPRYHDMAEATRRHSLATLTETDRQYLRGLSLHLALQRDGVRFFLCHAVPSNPLYGYCPGESDRWPKELEATNADVLLVGHTSYPIHQENRPADGRKSGKPGTAEDRALGGVLCGVGGRRFHLKGVSVSGRQGRGEDQCSALSSRD